MSLMDTNRIPLDRLSKACDCASELSFCSTTLDVPPLDGVIGQDRAVQSMKFGLNMDAPGYNIFVVGPSGTGKTTYSQTVVREIARLGTVPDDWCYIFNFAEPDNPLALSLPAGQGRVFQQEMDELVNDLKVAIPKAFESGEYEEQKDKVVQTVQKQMQDAFQAVEKEARANGFLIKQAPGRVVLMPLKEDKPLSPEEYDQLPELERKKYEEASKGIEKKIDETMHTGQQLEKKAKEQIGELDRQVVRTVLLPPANRLKEKYKDHAKIRDYLDALIKDIEGNHEHFKESTQPAQPQMPFLPAQDDGDWMIRYKVNLFVNNEKTEGAPVIIESFLYYYSLFGKVEYRNQMMAVTTNFTMAKSGAIHRANGGYLILQAKDVLTEPFVWDTLKRALKYRQAVVENIGEQYRYVPTVTMRMEPIPLNVKVVLIGTPMMYQILFQDEDFQKLFKVKVDFDVEMQRNSDNLCKYAAFVGSMCQNENLLPFSQTGLAQVIEYGSRLAGNQNKLSTRFNQVGEIVYEASALARTEKSDYVEVRHVDQAIRDHKFRSSRIEEKVQEMILQGKIMIDTSGDVVGQINGLSVISVGGYMFGQPSRITAVTFMGRGGIVNIERETEMSGNIHSKGVLTMSGFFRAKFGQEFPLNLAAQITFEQNYDGVDGDSASCAELYAILSSLAGVPIHQNFAVTGSVNQLGRVQPIGGVTEKVEGFFDICKAKGLTGDQGVIIPVQNIDNLMLKKEVIDAVSEGRFRLFAVSSVEEGIELLTGVPAGSKGEDGKYPDDSIYGKVACKLLQFHEKMSSSNGDNGNGSNVAT